MEGGDLEAKAPLLVAATEGQRLSSSGRIRRYSRRNSVNSLRRDFVARLPDKVRAGVDLESASHVDFSKTTGLAKGCSLSLSLSLSLSTCVRLSVYVCVSVYI